MKLSVEQIPYENEEEVIVRCYDTQEKWVEAIRAVTAGEVSVSAFAEEKVCRLKLSDVYYFEVVDGCSFLYCEKTVFKCRQKLYEFEELCRNSMLFRCSKSMILNADKIQYVRPSVSGRMEEKEKIKWLCCPKCGGKTRTQLRSHTVLEDFPLFCPKCKYTCVIYFKDGKTEEIKMPDA